MPWTSRRSSYPTGPGYPHHRSPSPSPSENVAEKISELVHLRDAADTCPRYPLPMPEEQPNGAPKKGFTHFLRRSSLGQRSLWDWLNLLIVPAVLVIGALWIDWQMGTRQQEIDGRRAERAETLVEQSAQETALQAYLDQISQLMLEEDLRNSDENSEVRMLARARTTALIPRLDEEHNRTVAHFLSETGLTGAGDDSVSLLTEAELRGADLGGAELRGADLSGADLSHADLVGADLRGAFLADADLRYANLYNATLSSSYLNSADFAHATLEKADLGWAVLSRASLRGTFMTDADLSNTPLIYADLRPAYISGVDFSGAILTGATGVNKADLEASAESLEGATMPDGSKHD